MTDRYPRTTPHRAPLLAAHARSAQLRQRIGEIDARSVGRIVEPLSFDGAIAEEQRLLRVLQSLEERARVETEDELDDASFAIVRPADDSERVTLDRDVPRNARAVLVMGSLVICVLLAAAMIFLLFVRKPPPAAAAPQPSLEAYFVVEVVDRTRSIYAHPGDRCTVELHLAREAACRMTIICPGIEIRCSSPTCSMPAAEARIEAHWPGVDFDGEYLSFVDMLADGNERGRATARVDAWR